MLKLMQLKKKLGAPVLDLGCDLQPGNSWLVSLLSLGASRSLLPTVRFLKMVLTSWQLVTKWLLHGLIIASRRKALSALDSVMCIGIRFSYVQQLKVVMEHMLKSSLQNLKKLHSGIIIS